MIFAKNFRLFRSFAVSIKAVFPKKETTSPFTTKVPIHRNAIFEICSLFGKEKINEFSLKSKLLFEKEKKITILDRFFELSLLYIKTNNSVYLEDMKTLEPQILKATKELKAPLLEKMDEKDLDLSPEKTRQLLRNSFGLNILSNLSKKINIHNADCFLMFQQFQKCSLENSEKLTTQENLSLELLYLILINSRLMGMSIAKMDQNKEKDVPESKAFFSFLFRSLELYPLYKKILLNSLEKPKSSNFNDLTESEMLWNTFNLILYDKDSTGMNDFLSLLWELNSVSKLSNKLSQKLLSEIMNRNNLTKEFSNKFSMFSVSLINILGQNLQYVSNSDFGRLLYLVAKENSSKYNYSVMNQFWLKVLLVFPQKYIASSLFMQKSILYSLGKMAFLNETIKQKIYIEELTKMSKVEKIGENNASIEKYITIMKSGMNLRVFDAVSFNSFMEIMEKKLENNPAKLNKMVMELAPSVIRVKYLDQRFWKRYFQTLETLVSEKNQNFFQIFFILKVFHFIFNGTFKFISEGDSKNKYPEVYSYFMEALNNNLIKTIFDKPLLHYYQEELNQDSKMVNAKSSLLEETLTNCLNSLGTPFIMQHCVEFMIVDFYLPLENIIVEVMGPSHIIKADGNNELMTLLTDFKLNCIRDLGYGLILIDHDQEVKKGFSIEQSFLKQYNDIVKNKK